MDKSSPTAECSILTPDAMCMLEVQLCHLLECEFSSLSLAYVES